MSERKRQQQAIAIAYKQAGKQRFPKYEAVSDPIHQRIADFLHVEFPEAKFRQRSIRLRREGCASTTRLLKVAAFVPDSHWIVIESSSWPTTLTAEEDFVQRAHDIYDAANNTQQRKVVILKIHLDDLFSASSSSNSNESGSESSKSSDVEMESEVEEEEEAAEEKGAQIKEACKERLRTLAERVGYYLQRAPKQPLQCEFLFYPPSGTKHSVPREQLEAFRSLHALQHRVPRAFEKAIQ